MELCDIASFDEVIQAFEGLTKANHLRIRDAARSCLPGTEYRTPQDLLNEVFLRTFEGALDVPGNQGRHWPKSVPFDRYLIKTIKGIAGDSRKSTYVSKHTSLDGLQEEQGDTANILNKLAAPSAEQVVFPDSEDTDTARQTAQAICTYFKGDPEVTWLLECYADEGCPRRDWRTAGLTEHQYQAARRRLRRALKKLFPGRSKR